MQPISFCVVVVLGAGSLAASMQDSGKQDVERESTQVDPVQKWIDLLGDPRYRVREQAFEELLKLGASAGAALDAAAGHEDPEVRWRVQRLREELGEDAPRRLRRTTPEVDPGDSLEEWRSRRRNLLRDHDAFNNRGFEELEAILRRVEAMRSGSIPRSPRPSLRPDWFGEPTLPLEDLVPPLGAGASWSFHRNEDGETRSVRIQIHADGSVEGEERAGDKITRAEAGSIDEMKQRHPEWFEQLNLRLRPLSRTPPRSLGPVVPDGPRPEPTPRGPRLGVIVEAVHPAVVEYLGLEDRAGLLVREVTAGSLAEQLGVHELDLILEVNQRRIHSSADVEAALTPAGSGRDVEVVVLRRGHRKLLRQL